MKSITAEVTGIRKMLVTGKSGKGGFIWLTHPLTGIRYV